MAFIPRRRKLPHSEYPGGTVCLNWRLHNGQPVLRPEERDRVLAIIAHDDGRLGRVLAAVVMDDHVHALITLFPTASARQAAQAWKSVSSHAMTREYGRRGPVWQRGYFDRWMLDQGRIGACARYIWMNPQRRWPGLDRYPWMLGNIDAGSSVAPPARP